MVECLGPEARDFLRDLLPIGSTVHLHYDVERTDWYGHTLASIATAGGLLVSEQIAQAGGYTGCRAYGHHGTSFDEIGRRYTKIPCP